MTAYLDLASVSRAIFPEAAGETAHFIIGQR
jgi:hypothetical protein